MANTTNDDTSVKQADSSTQAAEPEAAQPSQSQDSKQSAKQKKAEAKKAAKAAKAEKKAQKTAARKQKQAAADKSPRPLLAVLALFVAIGGYAAGYWVWLQGENNRRSFESSLAQLQQRSASEIQSLNNERAALENKLNEAVAVINNQQNQLALQVNHLNEAGKAISDRLGRHSTTWIVAEAEYLLNIANHRLSIDRDIASAIAALEASDARLLQVGDPGLLPVRKIIAQEITSLRSLDMPDVTGMAFELASLASSAEQLPLLFQQRREQFDDSFALPDQAARESGQVAGVMKAVWQDLKSLVVIRKNEKPVEALMAPDQRHFLFQNLILKLETGRLALLRGEQENLKASLDVAAQWLQAYFDKESAMYKNFDQTMARIASSNLNPALPDISKSLKALRRFKDGHPVGSKTTAKPVKKAETAQVTPSKATTNAETKHTETKPADSKPATATAEPAAGSAQ